MPTFQELSRRLGGAAAPKQAAVFLTHRETPRILKHYERLLAEASPIMPVYLCVHRNGPDPGSPIKPDFVVTDADIASTMPRRYAGMRQLKKGFADGFIDTVVMPVFTNPALAEYDYLWRIEFDVDFAGNWGDLFSWCSQSHADLIGDHFRDRSQDPDFYHWPWFSTPSPLAPEDQLKSFLPLTRFSRELIEAYVRRTEEGWMGHQEILSPTIAWNEGLSIASIAGTEPFSDPILHGVDGRKGPRPSLTLETYTFRPPVGRDYFHEVPAAFARRNYVYHPIKFAE